MKKKLFAAAMAGTMVLSLAACGGSKPAETTAAPAADKTEAAADKTEAAADGETKAEDDENDPEKSINAYNTLKDWGMQVLDGPTTSKPCIAVGAEAESDNMFLITPSGSAVECVATDNAFRV